MKDLTDWDNYQCQWCIATNDKYKDYILHFSKDSCIDDDNAIINDEYLYKVTVDLISVLPDNIANGRAAPRARNTSRTYYPRYILKNEINELIRWKEDNVQILHKYYFFK